ncbi:LysR family transcriptional regulator [Cupriavidus consociatus]|uniref:LysR family transcriptional regulator n=1 Tax=Cupriavidus consociatus TaxID=2821357 RepID=UPI001AE46F23|nr:MULTISPECIES: LysR family transcriptional regulator [unclassified Cupriavidus]MBP0621174.1 LysR family transcriptional regulator [Cupriavidus sp. LEh25]MDK2657844.1 LysR family transcriptional regulator [Cupriavidus sp. LEh21]
MRKNLDNGVFHAMRAFVCVVEAGSFSLAAEQLGLTTSQVSRLVGELEKRLNAKLLHRTTRQRSLTGIGADYLERCREVLALVAEAEAQASGTAIAPSGTLRLQCMFSFGQHYVVPLLPEFIRRYPDIQVEYSTSQYLPNLLARGTDVSLYVAERLPDSGLVSRLLGTTFSVLCASPAYLSQYGTPKKPTDLMHHPCLQAVNPSVSPTWNLVGPSNEVYEMIPKGPCIADTPDVLRAVAEAGMGIALLPLFSVIESIRSGHLKRVLAPWRSPDIGIFALMPSRHYMEAKTRAWLDFVGERMAPEIERDVRFIDSRRY